MAIVLKPAASQTRRARSRGIFYTAFIGVLVVLMLAFVAWKILDLASTTDQSRRAQIAFGAIEAEMAVQHGLEWESFAHGVTPELAAALETSQSTIEDALAELHATGTQSRSMTGMVVDVERVSAAVDREFRLMAAGHMAAAQKVEAKETHPAFGQITKVLHTLAAKEAGQSQEARNGLTAGTLLGLGGAAAGIVALLCLLAYLTRKGAAQQTRTLDELRQSQKMEAVGRLAGGVAHDFNNLLTAISGYSDLALARLDEGADPSLRDDIEEIAKAGERAAGLTRQLLALSRRQTLRSTVFDLNEAVSGTESLLRRLLGSHISIATRLDPGECLIEADHGQIEQIIMNFAVNARDAMPEGGLLRIETEALHLTEGEARRRFQAPAGEYVILRVADNGSGMDEATQQRAFEPFYTTKALGEGTGLGLATVYGIVAQSGGYIALESAPDAGTTFELLLPRVATPAAATTPTLVPTAHGGGERILLVEDEAVVRNLTRALLSREGYHVTVAADGEQALALSRDHTFDLVITDMVMPNMSGKVLAQHLLNERPDRPIIFTSGYAHDVGGGEVGAGDGFLQKPFSRHDLSVAVRTSLDRSPSRDRTAPSAA